MSMHVFNPDDFRAVVAHLAAEDGEAFLRTASSRAYYWVFLVARNLARIRDTSPDVHLLTQRHYGDLGETQIAKGLEYLRRRRNAADYLTERHFSRTEADAVSRRSRQVRDALKVVAGRKAYKEIANTC